MARKSRIEFAGAVYHVINRGSRREKIFLEDADREMFLRVLKETCERTGWRVHAYVLMGNHFHLLLETPQGLLSRGMHWLQTTYTSRFNRRHRFSGHVFQGRFKATIIDAEKAGYLATVADYIHLNPVRARLIDLGKEQLKDYPWSSLCQYAGALGKRPGWLVLERVLGEHGYRDRLTHRRSYLRDLAQRAQAENGPDNAQWEQVRRGWYLGSGGFRDRMIERLENARRKPAVHAGAMEVGADHAHWQADRIAEAGLKQLGLGQQQLRKLPKSDPRKVLIALLIKTHTAVSLRWISERLSTGAQSHVSRLTGRTLTKQGRVSAKRIMSTVKT